MMKIQTGQLFSPLPAVGSDEIFTDLLREQGFRLERIVSCGQSTPSGEWLLQDQDEWVVVLRGSAGIRIKDQEQAHVMAPGDFILIPAGTAHRVEWTAPRETTIWLALHYTAPCV